MAPYARLASGLITISVIALIIIRTADFMSAPSSGCMATISAIEARNNDPMDRIPAVPPCTSSLFAFWLSVRPEIGMPNIIRP